MRLCLKEMIPIAKKEKMARGTFASAAGGGYSEQKGVAQQVVLRCAPSEQDDYVATGR